MENFGKTLCRLFFEWGIEIGFFFFWGGGCALEYV